MPPVLAEARALTCGPAGLTLDDCLAHCIDNFTSNPGAYQSFRAP
jgi:hypothetical protein